MSKDDYARAIIAEGRRRGITPQGIKIALATTLVESNLVMYANAKVPESMALPHEAVGSDGMSVGLFQQQVRQGPSGNWWWGDARTCMDPTLSAGLFYDRLARLDYNHGDPGATAQAIQQSAFPDRYGQRMAEASVLYDRLAGSTVPDNRPDFNEFSIWSPSSQDRGGAKVDLFLLHTQEGGGGNSAAEDLANFLGNPANQVSYHYSVSQASDGGVTVVDVVDTDEASWSVLSANNRSINLCFAGSKASWSRADWMKQSKAIDVAAYLAVQDCKKYGIPLTVIGTGGTYSSARAGIADHQYVTKVLGDGTHTDVGGGFPVDIFTAAVAKYASSGPATPAPAPGFQYPSNDVLLREVWEQLRGYQGKGWPQLGGRTLVDAIAELLKKDAS